MAQLIADGVHDKELDAAGIDTKPNAAEITTPPCVRVDTLNRYHGRTGVIEYLLSLSPPFQLTREQLGEPNSDINIELPLDRLGFRPAPSPSMTRRRDYQVSYVAVFAVTVQNERFPAAFKPDGNLRIQIFRSRYEDFVRDYNRVATYYGLDGLDTNVLPQELPSRPWSFSIFGWEITIKRS